MQINTKSVACFLAALFSSTLAASPTKAQDKMAGELVVNSGFENTIQGAPIGWNGVPFVTTISTASHTGAHSLKLESTDAGHDPVAVQGITEFETGRPYRLQYDVRADRFGIEYRAYIGMWRIAGPEDPADTPASVQIENADTEWRQGTNAWHHISVDFTPTVKANRLEMVLQVKGPGTVWFDNVSITPLKPTAIETALPAPTTPFITPKPESISDATSGVKITSDRRFQVNGRPFFPIQIWGWTPYTDEALKAASESGFNIIGTPPFGESGPYAARAWLDAAQRHGLLAMVTMGFHLPLRDAADSLPIIIARNEKVMPLLREHPATFGYNLNDEPAWAGFDVAHHNQAAQWIKTHDSRHPVFVNHAPRNTIEELKRYNQFIDVTGSDIYPVVRNNISEHSDLPNKTLSVVGDETRKNLAAVDGKKPIMQTLQAFSWSDGPTGTEKDDPHPFPSRSQLRFMGWDSIVAGATGIAWFQDERYKELRPELKPVVREFAALQDVLAAGTPVETKGIFAAPIQSIAYKWNGRTVLVAINPTNDTVQNAPDWKQLFGGQPTLRVLWENRKAAALESFAPFDVHIYTDAAEDSQVLRAGFDVPPLP